MKQFALYDVAAGRSVHKKIDILMESDNINDMWMELILRMKAYSRRAKHYQIIERELTGILFVRVDVFFDGREFCKKPEDMGPEKYGFQ